MDDRERQALAAVTRAVVETLTPPSLGKSAIRRAAVTLGGRSGAPFFGNDAINEVSCFSACPVGIRAKPAASRQGSTSSLASAETILSGDSSSSIGANKKLSNSGPRRG
jgi:hypothetical protein